MGKQITVRKLANGDTCIVRRIKPGIIMTRKARKRFNAGLRRFEKMGLKRWVGKSLKRKLDVQ